MARKVECDRCGTQQGSSAIESPRGWTRASYETSAGGQIVKDLCATCLSALKEFLERQPTDGR